MMQGQNNINPPALVRWGVYIASALAVSIGTFWLVAWLSGVAARWSAAGGLTVKTNTALGMLLAGLALLLLGMGQRNGVRRWVGMLFAMLVFLIGALTLSEHLFGWNLGIDQLLAREPAGAAATASPNRMGYPGSSSLALLGMGLLALAFKRRAIVPYLGIAVCVINLIPTVGFLYGIAAFYDLPLTGIAWPTVIALMSLGIGLIFTRTDGGPIALMFSDDAGGKLIRGMLPWVILIPLVLGYLRVQGQERGFIGTALGTGTYAIVLILIFSAILWRSALKLSRSDAAHREDEEALRESEERFRAFMDNSSAAAWMKDEEGRHVYLNKTFKDLFGVRLGEWRGKTDFDIWPHEIAEELRKNDLAVLSSGQPMEVMEETPAPEGGRCYWWSSKFVLQDASGKRYVGGIGIDITDRKKAEEALRESEAHKRDFYRKTILAATGGKLDIVEPEDIRALHGELVQTWRFSAMDDYSLAMSQSFRLAESLGLTDDTLYRFMSCAGEMLGNAQKHAGGGEASLYRRDNRILYVVSDTGHGIESINLPDIAFVRGYSTAGTGGLGYKLIIGCADKTYLATGPDGTTVAIEIEIPG